MRGLGIGELDALQLDVFDGFGKFLLEREQFGELAGLFDDYLVELVVLMLEMREV